MHLGDRLVRDMQALASLGNLLICTDTILYMTCRPLPHWGHVPHLLRLLESSNEVIAEGASETMLHIVTPSDGSGTSHPSQSAVRAAGAIPSLLGVVSAPHPPTHVVLHMADLGPTRPSCCRCENHGASFRPTEPIGWTSDVVSSGDSGHAIGSHISFCFRACCTDSGPWR